MTGPDDELTEEEWKRTGGVASWCPGGSASGGICTPPNNNRPLWMQTYAGSHPLPIGEMVLPGTHNAGSDKKAPRSPSNETCQDVPIYEQLVWGIRAFDLRVQFFPGATGPARFAIVHDQANGRDVETDVLQALQRFRRDAGAANEIVVLDFHELRDFSIAAHDEFAGVIKRVLGDSIVPPWCKPAAIKQLWTMGKTTVVAYASDKRDTLFWPGVEQMWIGENTPGKDKMSKFIEDIGSRPKGFGDLRSVQAAYYSLPFFVPKDLSSDLMSWFAATSTGGRIAGHYIINTDWSLRQRLVDNVILANHVRGQQRGAHLTETRPSLSGNVVPTNAYTIFTTHDGDHEEMLILGRNTSGHRSIVLVQSYATLRSHVSWGDSVGPLFTGGSLLFSVESGQTPRLIGSFPGTVP